MTTKRHVLLTVWVVLILVSSAPRAAENNGVAPGEFLVEYTNDPSVNRTSPSTARTTSPRMERPSGRSPSKARVTNFHDNPFETDGGMHNVRVLRNMMINSASHAFCNEGFTGSAPDLGALEIGRPLPHFGPRP